MTKAKIAATAKQEEGAIALSPRNTVISYGLLAVFGVLGAHRFYHRRVLMAAAQIFLTILVILTFGTHIGLYLGLIMIGWLIADAVTLRKWNEEDGLAPAAA